MRRLFLALTLFGLAAGSASADVDVDTGAAALKTKSTIEPANEVEVYHFDAVTGAKLTLTLASKGGAHLAFAVTLHDPSDVIVPIDASLHTTAKGVSLKNFVLPASGSYRLEVTAPTPGSYALALKVTPQTKFVSTLAVPIGDPHQVDFSAPPGSSVTFSAKAKKSAAAPVFGTLSGTDYAISLASAGVLTSHSHVVTVPAVEGTGDLVVGYSNTGEAGDVVISITVHPPKTKPVHFDLRGIRLGHPSGGETFVVRLVDDVGGLVEVGDATSDLFGASVSIPAGALTGSLPISIGSSPPVAPTSQDDQAAGLPIDLQPSGTTFKSAVTVTLPFDFSMLPANASASEIRVLIREDDGSERIVIPLSIDQVAGTVTLQTSGFSVCVPIIRAGLPQLGLTPGGDEYWTLFLRDEMQDDQLKNDSRRREFSVDVGEATFFSDNTLQYSAEERSFEVSNSDDGNGGVTGQITSKVAPDGGTGTWSYFLDGQSISINTGGNDAPFFQVSRDGSAMVGHGAPAASTKADLNVLIRKNKEFIGETDLKGAYSLAAVEIGGQMDGGPGAPAYARPAHVLGQCTFDGRGGFTIAATQSKTRFDSATNTWGDRLETLGTTSTYEVEKVGTILLTIPPDKPGDTGNVLRLFPGRGLDVLIGSDAVAQGDNVFAIILVRRGSGLSTKSLLGPYRSAQLEVNAQTYTLGGGPTIVVPELNLRDGSLGTTFDGTSSTPFTEFGREIMRDPSVTGGVRVDAQNDSFTVDIAVDAKGGFKMSEQGKPDDGVMGAFTPDTMFGFFVNDIHQLKGQHFLGFFVKVPPLAPQSF